MNPQVSRTSNPGGPYRRAAGAVVAFLTLGLYVKYSELLFTHEHRLHIPSQGTLISRAAQVWLSLRFSWQEFTIACVLLTLIVVCQWWAPRPNRVIRLSLGAIRVALAAASLLAVLGIAYYAVYQTHMTKDDAQYLGWTSQLISTSSPFQWLSVRIGTAVWLAMTFGLPWMAGRVPWPIARVGLGAATLVGFLATITYASGRPNLAEALLEPNPTLWMLVGHRMSYVDLPSADVVAPIGKSRRLHAVTERPRNVIIVALESTPASAVVAYSADAPGGRRLFDEFGQDVTVFDQVYSVVPNSSSSFFDVIMGRSPLPTGPTALERSAGLLTLGEVLSRRGFRTEMYLNGYSDPLLNTLANRSFDRFIDAEHGWPDANKYARLQWGFDDRMLFDEAQDFLQRQTTSTPPFLLALYTNNPHVPYSTELIPGLGANPDPKQRHRRMVQYDFDLLTDMYAFLKRSGLAESTAVIVFGDHGEAFDEHPDNIIHAKELFTENLHVPFLLVHPRRLGLPARIRQLGSLDDVLPTVCDLLGIDVSGRSGMSLLFEAPEREIFSFTDYGPGQVALRDSRFSYLLSRNGREQLFDRTTDPGEQINVLAKFPDVVTRFRSRLVTPKAGR